MKKGFLFILCAFAAFGVSCVKDKDSLGTPDTKYNKFEFKTAATVTLNIDYGDMGMTEEGSMGAEVYFEVYDQMPVKTVGEEVPHFEKIEGLQPLYTGYTDENGVFSGEVELPTYLTKAYIYTPAFYAQTLLEATRTDNVISAKVVRSAAVAAMDAVTRANYYTTDAVTKDGWKEWLGDYNRNTGKVNYKCSNNQLKVKNTANLYKAHSSVIDINMDCPAEYRSSKDLYINEDAEVAVTFLGSNTCWNSSLGYYIYKDGEKPASLSDIDVVLIFPNTQDGEWSVNPSAASSYKGTARSTAVQLKYFPNGEKSATNVIPAGYRVGFVLATNAWTNRLPNFAGDKKYRAATSDGLSVNNNGVAYSTPRSAVYRYVDGDESTVIISFEDFTTDENFSDVVFALSSNPVEAVTDIPVVGEEETKTTVGMLKGVYSFEDLWPSRGDYDMNDVMVCSSYEKTSTSKGIFEESFLMTTYSNFAAYSNGLAVTLTGSAATGAIKCYKKAEGDEQYTEYAATRDGNVLLLAADVKGEIGMTYKVTATYTAPQAASSEVHPFIYRTEHDKVSAGNRWEVHIPGEAPSAKMETSMFGTGDDRSNPAKGAYYVREGNYPFAFFLAGATVSDVAKLLVRANETKPIDELYPSYTGWVTSNGASNTDWYKK